MKILNFLKNLYSDDILANIIKTANSGLLVWYGISMYTTYLDNTIGTNLKILGEFINFLMVSLLFRVVFGGYKKPTGLDFCVCAALFFWFIYYTVIDAASYQYPTFVRIFYTTIDCYSLIFLIDTFSNLIVNTEIYKSTKERMNGIFRWSLAFLLAFVVYAYVKCLRIG
jgi:hypothetical protein